MTTKTEKMQLDLDSSSSSSSSSSSAPSSSAEEDNSDHNNNDNKLTINAKFAKEYEKRKRKQELINERQRRKQEYGDIDGFSDDDDDDDDGSSSSEESEDEDAELLTPKVDLQILKTINALRSKDDSIYNQETKFYSDDDDGENYHGDGEEDEGNSDTTGKKLKPKLYRDVIREEILQKMKSSNDANDDDDDDDDEDMDTSRYDSNHKKNQIEKLAYDEEQIALRSAFLTSGDDDDNNEQDKNGSHTGDYDNDNDWLLKKKIKKNSNPDENDDIEKHRLQEIDALTKSSNKNDVKLGSNNDTLKDPKGEIEDGEQFLFDFIKNKRWVDNDKFDFNQDEDDNDEGDTHDEHDNNLDDGNMSDTSLNQLDKTDDFESKYNFRFEEATNVGLSSNPMNATTETLSSSGAGLSVVGYSRESLSDTVRRKDESRKLKRKQRKERKLAERKAKEEQLKRLKNAKKEEMEDRIKKIKNVIGDKASASEAFQDEIVNEELVAKLMDGDFDPDKFEDIMSKMYNADFYEKEDDEWKDDTDVKESLRRSEFQDEKDVINELDDAAVDEYNGDGAAEEAGFDENDQADDAYNQDDEGEYVHKGNYEDDYQEEGTGDSTLDKKLKEHMMDELYKLDYEDIIGGMPTRFKYRKVEANRYGLTPEEILFSRDTTLKQFVSLKRMVPYDDGGEYNPGTKRRKRFRDMFKTDMDELLNEDDNQSKINDAATDAEQRSATEPIGIKKRRRQKKGKKKKKESDTAGIKRSEKYKDKADLSIGTNDQIEEQGSSTDTKHVEAKKNGRKKKGKKMKKTIRKEDEQDGAEGTTIPKDSPTGKTKKKRKKVKTTVQGISESRLASYNF